MEGPHGQGEQVPRSFRTSPIDAKDEFYSALVETCSAATVAALGEDAIRALLMIGAPARSEVTVIEAEGGFYSLSDVDLVCVVRQGVDPVAVRDRLDRVVSDLNHQLGDKCSGVDVAVKTEEQIGNPRPAISLYEMIRSPMVIWGDERVASVFGDIDIADVPNTESLVLIHNRMLEELILRPVDAARRSRTAALATLYGTAKLVLDSITAYLFIRNQVPTSFRDRVTFFMSDVLERPESAELKRSLAGYLDELPAWAAFKTTGDLEGLAAKFGSTTDVEGLDTLARETWHRYVGYAEVFWRDVLGNVARTNTTGRDMDFLAKTYVRLEPFQQSVWRAYKMIKSGRSPKGLFSTVGTLARGRFGSPRLLAYLTAVVTYLSYSDAVDWIQAERIVRHYCPFNLPRGFSSLADEQKREVLIGLLQRLHHGILLGRKG